MSGIDRYDRIVRMQKIGVMGARGSFSEQAGEYYVTSEALREVEIVPLVTAEAVLDNLQIGLIDKGIFPVMNNNGGVVIEALHAVAKFQFEVVSIFEMDIHHMLMVLPTMTAERITTVTSHDQAIKQCRGYLEKMWSHAEVLPHKDTAQAAADLAQGILTPTTAVIASRRASELYGLTIIASAIQDAQINKTTFVVAKRRL
jgi:prephenate dehydratase